MFLHLVFCIYWVNIHYLTVSSGFLFDQVDGPLAQQSVPSLAEPPLKIATFNIKIFGQTKFGKTDIVDIIVEILSRYDIIEVLEIRDSHETVFDGLLDALNNYTQLHGEQSKSYEKVVSARLGRNAIKEQYGFLYRTSSVQVTDSYQFPDTEDVFARPPFGVKFKSPTTIVEEFGIIASNVQPTMAAEEMDNLTAVYETFHEHWNISDILIAGTFNADCTYLKQSDWNNISLRTDARFTWLVDDDVDTTVAGASCSYDRFVVAGDKLLEGVVPGSVMVYKFDEQMYMNKSMAVHVSDHYPIEMELKGKPHVSTQQNIETSVSFTVTDAISVSNVKYIRDIYRDPSCAGNQYDVKVIMENSHMDYVTARVTHADAKHVMTELQNFRSNCPGTLSVELLSMINGYIQSAFLTNRRTEVYGLVYSIKKHVFETVVKCSLQTQYLCEVTLSKQVSG